jgi:hypothetical protein
MANPTAVRPYHHGNLREALQDAVLGLVAEHGVGAVTMAAAAPASPPQPRTATTPTSTIF